MKFATKRTAIEADAIYDDNRLVANDCSVTLPEISFMTADISAMGTASIPLQALLEDMEMSITRVGADKELVTMCRPGTHSIEVRWVQDVVSSSGAVSTEGCKAFIKGMPAKIPGIGIEIGSAPENELTFKVTRYKLVINGNTVLLIDRFAHKFEVNGKDYYKQYGRYL